MVDIVLGVRGLVVNKIDKVLGFCIKVVIGSLIFFNSWVFLFYSLFGWFLDVKLVKFLI